MAKARVSNFNAQTPGTGESIIASIASPSRQGEPAPPGESAVGIPHIVSGVVNLTVSTGTLSVTVRVRRGIASLTGTTIGAAVPHTLASGQAASIPFNFDDQVGVTDGYTVTITPNGATAGPTVNYVSVDCETL